jgi:hypothetical protein
MFLLDIILAVFHDAAHIRAVHLVAVYLIKQAKHEIVRGRLSLLSSYSSLFGGKLELTACDHSGMMRNWLTR